MYKDYNRKDRIGKGNFATVYSWERKTDNLMFAVKSLDKKKILEAKNK